LNEDRQRQDAFIEAVGGVQFSPEIVKIFCGSYRKLRFIFLLMAEFAVYDRCSILSSNKDRMSLAISMVACGRAAARAAFCICCSTSGAASQELTVAAMSAGLLL
jgi:hypothetical protein